MMKVLQSINVALVGKQSIENTVLYVKHWAYLRDRGAQAHATTLCVWIA